MATQALAKMGERIPFVFDDFFKPWNEWFDDRVFPARVMNVPAVNITEQKDQYLVSLAAPGLKKEDFNWLMVIFTISNEKKR
jgi:HSP20 family protein